MPPRHNQVVRRNPYRQVRRVGAAGAFRAAQMGGQLARQGVRYAARRIKKHFKNKSKKNKSREDANVANQYSAGIALKTITFRKSNKKLMKYCKVATNDCTYQWIETTLATSQEGLQAPSAIATMCSSSKIQALCNVAMTSVSSAGGNAIVASGNAYASATKFFLKGERQIVRIVNQAPTTATIRIYHLISKVTKVALTNPATDWQTGIQNEDTYQTNVVGGNASYTYPSSKPTTSKLFNINWKIENVKTAQLMPGQEITDIWSFTHNKVIDEQYFLQYAQVKGITCTTMIVYSGNLVDTIQSLTTGSISIAPCKLACSAEHIITGNGLSPFQKATFQETTAYGTADAHIYTVQEESGLPVDATLASNYA